MKIDEVFRHAAAAIAGHLRNAQLLSTTAADSMNTAAFIRKLLGHQ